MNKTTLSIIIILLVIFGIGYYLLTQYSGPVANPAVNDVNVTNTVPSTNDTTNTTDAVKEFTVTGRNFSFAPATITVKQGDHVKINFVNADGFHDLRIDAFNVATQRIQGGQQETVEFTADKTGTFEYYCSVANHRAMGMVGTLTVE